VNRLLPADDGRVESDRWGAPIATARSLEGLWPQKIAQKKDYFSNQNKTDGRCTLDHFSSAALSSTFWPSI
jgi:hypothetical protein